MKVETLRILQNCYAFYSQLLLSEPNCYFSGHIMESNQPNVDNQDFYLFAMTNIGINFSDKHLILTKTQKMVNVMIFCIMSTYVILCGNFCRHNINNMEKLISGVSLFIVGVMTEVKTLTFCVKKKAFFNLMQDIRNIRDFSE